MKLPPVRFGLIGTGAIAQTYAQAFDGWPGARLAAVADTRLDAATAMADAVKCPAFGSYCDMLASAELDAVIVCTPPNTHEEIVVAAVGNSLHVLCEKPFALDSAAARRMIDAAERAGVKLTMASKFRYTDDLVRAKSIVTSGILGEILAVENAFTAKVEMAGRWNSDPAVSGGGVLIDNGTHSVDIVRYFLGPIAEVMAVEGKRAQGLAVEDTARIFLRSVDGVIGTIDLSWSLDKSLEHYLWIYGSEGEIRVGWRSSEFRQVSNPSWVSFGSGYDKAAAMGGSVENFCNAVAGRESLLITAEDAIASVAVVERAYESMRSEHWVPVSATPAGADQEDHVVTSTTPPASSG